MYRIGDDRVEESSESLNLADEWYSFLKTVAQVLSPVIVAGIPPSHLAS